jgi:hypothetical protein
LFGVLLLRAVSSLGVECALKLDDAVFADTEVRVGSAPVAPRESPERTFVVDFEPGAAVRLSERRWSLVLGAGPRFYYRVPNFLDLHRPLVLLQGHAEYRYDFSPRVRWTSRAETDYGEVDYTSAQLAFGTPVARQIETPVLKIFTLGGSTGFDWTISRRYSLATVASVMYTVPTEELDPPPFPTTAGFSVDLRPRWLFDRVSSFYLSVTPHYYYTEPGADYTSLAESIGYQRSLSRATELETSAGASVTRSEDAALFWTPLASVRLSHISYRRRGLTVTNHVQARVETRFDPSIGQVFPTAAVEADASEEIGEHWTLTTTVTGTTTVTAEPVTQDAADSSFGASIVLARDLAPGIDATLGARYSTWATHLRADHFMLFDRQVWAFVGLRAVFGAGPNEGDHGWVR